MPRFKQRRSNGEGGWLWSVKDTPGHDRLLYRLPGLRAAGDAIVWICEGEKDADNLHNEGLIATTNIGGAMQQFRVFVTTAGTFGGADGDPAA